MAIQCANCRANFTADELVRLRPPHHPWPLTAAGYKAAYDNQARGSQQPACPMCGNHTLPG